MEIPMEPDDGRQREKDEKEMWEAFRKADKELIELMTQGNFRDKRISGLFRELGFNESLTPTKSED